jgi:hypothetical protein
MGNQNVICDMSFGTSFAPCDQHGMVCEYVVAILTKFLAKMSIWVRVFALMLRFGPSKIVYRTVICWILDTMDQSLLGPIGRRPTQISECASTGLLQMEVSQVFLRIALSKTSSQPRQIIMLF